MARRGNTPLDIFLHIDMVGGDKEACWPWKRKLNVKDQRPYFTINGKRRPAYVIALELFTGEDADERMALHSCDNSSCCNPHHLSWGDQQKNMNDMKERDRHGMPKTVARAMMKLIDKGHSHKSIAELYGVSRETVTALNNGRSRLPKPSNSDTLKEDAGE